MKACKTILLSWTLLLVIATAVKAEDPVVFADSSLEAAVREALGIPSGDIMPADMLKLTKLVAPLKGITNLTGLEYATNLVIADIGGNQIADISPLADLVKLRDLRLPNNRIQGVSALASLTELNRLDMHYNQVGSIGPLGGLTKLTRLTLHYNQISDISALSTVTNLTLLTLSYNQIQDISALAGLTQLTRLDLDNNQIGGIGAVAGLTRLYQLTLDQNQIQDISALVGLTALTRLDLPHNQIADIGALAGLTKLTRLTLGSNQISDISALSGLTNLTLLTLYLNQIEDLSALANLTALNRLELQLNPIHDVSPLTELTSLQTLKVWGCPLSWESYCIWGPQILSNNPNLTDVKYDPNPYNCNCEPGPTPEGSGVTVEPPDNTTNTTPVTLTFEQVTKAGGTTLVTSTSGPTPGPGFQLGNPATYYSITTTASYTGLIDVCISYAGVSFPPPPEALRLFHYEDGQWVDCTTIVYTQSQTICGAVTSLSPFAIMAPLDATPPVFQSLVATPNVLWPPNHKMIPIAVVWSVTDNVDPGPTVVLKTITMNEGDETNTYDPGFDATTGDGHTTDDIQVDVNGDIFLRAERAGTGTGRTYTLLYQATDATGNTATATVIVTVPHKAP